MLETVNKKYLACILFTASVLIFARTIQYDAVWDDARVHFNPANQVKMDQDVSAFWTEHSGMYIPLTYTTWALVKQFFSAGNFNPAPFHLLNLITHSINAVLLFYLLLLLFKNKTAAFFGGVLFLVHPIQVESIAWISEFRGLYSTFFCLISLLLFFKQQETGKNQLFFSKGYWLALVFYILALLAKPSGIVLPLIILVLSWRYYKEYFNQVAKLLLPWLLPAVIFIFLLMVKNPESNVSLVQRFLIAGYTLFFYIQKIIVPYPLVACYGYTPAVVAANFFSSIAFILCISIFILLIIKRNKFPDVFTAFLLVFICVLPVLGFIPFAYQAHSTVADRYAYMALIGPAMLLPSVVKRVQIKPFLKSGLIAFLIAFAAITIRQTSTWKNEFTLWDHTLKFYDNSSTVYYDRGVQYSLKGNFSNAIADYTRALALKPDNLDALFNRANAYENRNELNAAFNDYAVYLKINSKDGSVYYKRSYLFYKTGKLDEALDDLQRAEELGFRIDVKYKEHLLREKFSK